MPERFRLRGAALLAALLLAPHAAGAEAPDATPLPRPAPRAAAEAGPAAPAEAPLPVPRYGEETAAGPVAPGEAPHPPALPGTPERPEGPERPPPEAAAEAAEAPGTDAAEEARAEPERSPYAVATAPLPPERPGIEGSTLIGIFALTTGRTALMRFPSGEVRRLSIGDEVDGWRVDSIARDSLRFARGGRERTFPLVGN